MERSDNSINFIPPDVVIPLNLILWFNSKIGIYLTMSLGLELLGRKELRAEGTWAGLLDWVLEYPVRVLGLVRGL